MSNFSIVKKICRQNILLRLIGAGALILLAVIMAFGLLPKTTRYLLARNNVFATPTNKYKVDKFYQGKTYSIYDWFAENDDGRFYLSPVADENGNEEFLIVYIPKRYEAKAERIMEQTWSYMETGDEDDLKEYISCRGMITTINTKTTQYVNEYFDMVGAPQMKSKVCDTMFVMIPLKEVLLSQSTLYLILIILLPFCAIGLIISGFTKRYLKNLKNRLARENMTLKDLDEEFRSPVINVKNIYVSDKHVVSAAASPQIVTISDVIWMYPARTNQINSNSTIFNAFFYTRNHECIKFAAKDMTSCEVLCQAVKKLQPRALYGYVIENTTMYYSHFNELVDQVYNQTDEPAPDVPASEAPAAAVLAFEAPAPAAPDSEVPSVETPAPETPATPETHDYSNDILKPGI